MSLKGEHTCYYEWAVQEETFKRLRLRKLKPIIENLQPVLIKHEYISWKGKDNPQDKIDGKYKKCDISIPGIVSPVKNYHNCLYRMIDGSHRMAKMILETDISESYFYVITPEIFYSLLEDCPENRKHVIE